MGSLRDLSRCRPSPGTVIACIALVVACTGSASAATLITGAQIKNNSVSTKDVKNKSLQAGDFRPGDLPPRIRGRDRGAGAQCAKGVPGLSGLESVEEDSDLDSDSPKSLVTRCPAGKQPICASYDIVDGKTGTAPNTLLEVTVDVFGTVGPDAYADA